MFDIFSALMVGSIIAFLLYKNLKKITDRLDIIEDSSFEIYSNFAVKAEEYLREIKNDIEKEEKLFLKERTKKKEIAEKFLDLIRELLFFETIQAKQMKKAEAEEKLFEILSSADEIIRKEIKEGEKIADSLREKLLNDYEKIKDEIR